MDRTALLLNQLAQGLIPIDDGLSWFRSLSEQVQREVLVELAGYCSQAHPHRTEVGEAIDRAGLKPTFTPCVWLLRTDQPGREASRLASLPSSEHLKSFRLMVSLLSIADGRRRRTDCKDGCSHEWHKIP